MQPHLPPSDSTPLDRLPSDPAKADALSKGRLVEQFLQNQSQEIALRAQELELQKHTADTENQYACAALSAQERILQADFLERRKQRRDTYLLIFACAFIVAALVAFALWKDKDAIVMEIVKAVLYLATGSMGGYALGKRDKNEPKQPASNDQD